jgi:hypothetical protein
MARTLTKAAWIAAVVVGIGVASGFFIKAQKNQTLAHAPLAATTTPLVLAPAQSDTSQLIQAAPAAPPEHFSPSHEQANVATPKPSNLPVVASNDAVPPRPESVRPAASKPMPDVNTVLAPQARRETAPMAVQGPVQSAQMDPAPTPAKTSPALASTEAVIVTAQRPQQVARVDVESLSRGNSLTIQLPKRRK